MEVNIEKTTCSECGVLMWITEGHMNKLRKSHETFYCPNGHSLHFPQKNDAEKIQEELNEERKRIRECSESLSSEIFKNNNLRKSINGYKGMLGRYKKEKGVLKNRTSKKKLKLNSRKE